MVKIMMLLFKQGMVKQLMTNNKSLENGENLAKVGVHFLRNTRADQLMERISLPNSDSSSQDVQEFTEAVREKAQQSFESQLKFLKKRMSNQRNTTN